MRFFKLFLLMFLRIKFFVLQIGERFLLSSFRYIFFPFSWAWAFFSYIRNLCYDWKIFKSIKISKPVICVGNISVGGTGKTPLVILLGKRFSNRKIAIISRGYGAQNGLNDEMRLIQKHLPNALLFQGAKRSLLAQKAAKKADLILLDDGFQHRKLDRNFDFVVVRSKDLDDYCLPIGRLRESSSSLQRADAIFSYQSMENAIGLHLKVSKITTLEGKAIKSIQNQKVAVFCGIANPERFIQTIRTLGAEIMDILFLADHEPITFSQLKAFFHKNPKVQYLICTEKDAVKIKSIPLPILVVEVEAEVVSNQHLWDSWMQKIEKSMEYGR